MTRKGSKGVHPQKVRGNIFEISDRTESLYEAFGEHLFNEKIMDRIQMLRPENRIEQLFAEGGNTEAISGENRKINIEGIDFRDNASSFLQHPVQIPPISMRAMHVCKLLGIVNAKTDGVLAKEKRAALKAVLDFKVTDEEDAKEISKLIETLDKFEREANEDNRLSPNCREHKPELFNEVKWLLTLTALTSLQLSNSISQDVKKTILNLLGFDDDVNRIDEYREQCVREGFDEGGTQALYRDVLDWNKMLSQLADLDPRQFPGAKKVQQQCQREDIGLIYWASCFTGDHLEFRELFESKDWTHNVKQYIIK